MACTTCPTSHGNTLPLAAWAPFVQPFVYDAPIEAITHAVCLTAIDFANETGILTRDLLLDAMANVMDYPLEVESGYVIRALTRVRDENDRYIPLLSSEAPWASTREGARLQDLDTLLVYPVPRADRLHKWRVTVVVAPTPATQELDRVLFDHHAEAIGLGAAARVKMMPGGDWTDPRGSGLFMTQYRQKRADAKTRKQRNNQRGPVFMTAPRWV